MRHPNLELFRARLRDLADLGLPQLSAALEITEEAGKLPIVLPEAWKLTRDKPATGPKTAAHKAAILAVLEDLADDLLDACGGQSCLCSMRESCAICERYAALASCRAFRCAGPIVVKLEPSQFDRISELMAANASRGMRVLFEDGIAAASKIPPPDSPNNLETLRKARARFLASPPDPPALVSPRDLALYGAGVVKMPRTLGIDTSECGE